MTQLTHCDGPGCEVAWDAEHPRLICEVQIHVEPYNVDFHSRRCLANWAAIATTPGILDVKAFVASQSAEGATS